MKRILIMTGQSGSGKSSALQVLEDLGYYCIDNLPLALLPEIVAKLDCENNLEQLALGVDVRSTRADLQEFDHVFEQLQQHGTVDVIYLTTQDQELIARFSASRRPHPLAARFKSLHQCIQEEKVLLMPIQLRSTVHIDTTDKSVHDLKHTLLYKLGQTDNLIVILQSFGYKHGIPLDADYVLMSVICRIRIGNSNCANTQASINQYRNSWRKVIRSKTCFRIFITFRQMAADLC